MQSNPINDRMYILMDIYRLPEYENSPNQKSLDQLKQSAIKQLSELLQVPVI